MIKTEYPYINDEGQEDVGLIKTYTDDETKVLRQVDTDTIYGDMVIDIYPCPHEYEEVDKPVEEEEEEHESERETEEPVE